MKKTLIGVAVFLVSFTVLFVSIFDSSTITYPVSHTTPQTMDNTNGPLVNYNLPYMGNILPDSPLWRLKALRDKIWFGITTSHIRKAQIALLFADKRLAMSQKLFEMGEPEVALSTFTKAEKYLPIALSEEKIARSQGINTNDFLLQLATACLKHKEVADNLIHLAPENAAPIIIENEVYANNVYEDSRNILNSKGITPPNNPFDRE